LFFRFYKWFVFVCYALQAGLDKWMSIPDIGYLIANRYNVIVVCLCLKQSITIFPLRTQPPNDLKLHRIIYIRHVYGNYFVEVFVIDLILSFNIIYYIMCSLLVVHV